jgi:ArsR family transcriptional regulator
MSRHSAFCWGPHCSEMHVVVDRQRSPVGRDVVRVLAALAEENRFRIVELLGTKPQERETPVVELSCGAIGTALGLSPSLLSHHLSILESAGVIERRRNGLWTLNRLCREELSRHLQTLSQLL